MAKTTAAALHGVVAALVELHDKPMKSATSAKIVRLAEWAQAQPAYTRFTEARGRLAEEHGVKVSDGKWEVPIAKLNLLLEGLKAPGEEVVFAPDDLLLSMQDLGEVVVSPSVMRQLSPVIKDFWAMPPRADAPAASSPKKE